MWVIKKPVVVTGQNEYEIAIFSVEGLKKYLFNDFNNFLSCACHMVKKVIFFAHFLLLER